MSQYATVKKAPVKATIRFERVIKRDDTAQAPDKMCDGYWPSLDAKDAGYIGKNPAVSFDDQMKAAKERMEAWKNDVWQYVGIIARAYITIPIGHTDTCTYTIESAGIWGIESDSDESFLDQTFDEQKDELIHHIKQFSTAEIV